MEIISQNSSKFTYLTFVIYKTCLSQFVSHMHEAQVRGICWGEGAYLHFTATTPFFETVCKQFINGSVPFGLFPELWF